MSPQTGGEGESEVDAPEATIPPRPGELPPGSNVVTSTPPAALTKPLIFNIIEPPSPVERLEEAISRDPCGVLGHQPAYLTGGGIACYRCGARYA